MNILITGGASGLGEAITRKLASYYNHTIYFTYQNSESSANKICDEFENCKAIKCDFTDKLELESLIEKLKTFDLDILINNAYSGEAIHTHFQRIKINEFTSNFENNIIPTVQITQAAIDTFKKKKSGKIITILTSFLTNRPPVGSSIYVANKAYLASLVKSWANECVGYNVTSNSISPSFMQTNFTRDVDERIIKQMTQNHPLKKLLTKEEVADSVDFLVHSSNQINGLDLLINAGVELK
jgi:3-oxoacyl-[acyl-carrier protein] reductase